MSLLSLKIGMVTRVEMMISSCNKFSSTPLSFIQKYGGYHDELEDRRTRRKKKKKMKMMMMMMMKEKKKKDEENREEIL
ncbi:hypothetical protein H5410_004041 [Solanum commersonii]|uniref:Uncharacterized protein n=1 Tax=Solanum commersonii TaxID=4109 RepID=A0A9J6B6Y5_SOLCO|nr:hypothetical protein H5410_004041 [Solanum commersonii]